MTEEIKEILKALKPHDEVKEYPLILSLEQQKILLDYITNLQQLYENGLKVNQSSHKYITELEMNNAILKEDLDKTNDIIKKDRQFYKCRMDEYVELKKEKKRLKEELNYTVSQVQHNQIVTKLCKEKEDYKSKCEKANEYVNKMWIAKLTPDIVSKTKGDLLNILNGGNEK